MNHYDTLEVSPAASAEVIRAAYRSLMQRFHPDKNPGDEAVGARAAAIVAAYDVLSDAARRAEYDRQLQAAQGQVRAMPTERHAPHVHARASPRAASAQPSRMGTWLWLLPVAAAAAIGVFASLKTHQADPGAELAAIRQSFASKTATEAHRRELYSRKAELLQHHPELLRAASAEKTEDMAARTFVLLEAPLVVRVGQDRGGPAQPAELTIKSISLLLGSFDAGDLLAHMGRHRERLVQDLAARLAKEDPARFGGVDGEAQLKRVVKEAMAATLRTDQGQQYPSTWFESPGRYGVVDVVLPERFKFN